MSAQTIEAARPATFSPSGIEIEPEPLLRVLGYRNAAPVRPQVLATAQAMAGLAVAASTPRVAYRRVRIASCTPEGLVLATGTRFRGSTFAAELADCDEVALFVLSLGGRFDSTQKHLAAAGKTLEAYMLEIAGWLAIEKATRLFRKHLQAEAKREALALTRRMAPGYTTRVAGLKVEWPLEDQEALFSLFDESAPARLLEGSCAMTPKMSRSGLFGLARAAAVSNSTDVPQETMQDE
jgi:hypothetical protein